MENTKSLVLYYSRADGNYFGGTIKNLTIGNTQIAAEKLQKLTGSDIFRIEPVKEYPADYYKCIDVAKQELHSGARPAYKKDFDISKYQTIYLGYPNWWGTMPMTVFTFLEAHDFEGKNIHPFCTNEGSGMGSSESDLRKICPKALLKKGLPIRGASVSACDSALEKWIKSEK